MSAQTRAIVDKLLTNVSIMVKPEGYISEEILPMISVKQKSGLFGEYGLDHLRQVEDLAGGRGEARRVDAIKRLKNKNYLVETHALEDVVTQDDYDNVEDPFEAEADTTTGLTSLILTNKERKISSVLNDTAIMTQNLPLSGTDKFSDYANSKPLDVFKDSQNAILDGCGQMPNAAAMSQKVFNTLKYHPDILGRLGFAMNRAGSLSEQEVAKAMGVDQLFIGNVPYNQAKEGQTDALAQIWPDSILFYVRPAAAAKRQVSLGYYVRMTSRKARLVYKYLLNNPVDSYGIIVQDDYSFEVTNAKAGYLITGVL